MIKSDNPTRTLMHSTFILHREKQFEHGPFPRGPFRPDEPFMIFHDLPADRQAYARSLECFPPMQPLEHPEYPFRMLRTKTYTILPDTSILRGRPCS